MEKVLRISILCFLVVFLLVLSAFGFASGNSGTSVQELNNPFVIKFGHMNSIEDNVHKAGLMIKENVENKTNGAFKIEIFPSGQLGENKEVLEQARLGGNIMGQVGLGNIEEYIPNFGIFLGPFLFNNWEEAVKLINSDLVREWERELEEKAGIIILAYANFGVRDLYTVNKPVRKPEDTKGLKIRVQPVKMYTEMIKSMGATPTPMPWPEVYSALAQKVIDGAEAPPRSMLDQRHYELVKYFNLTDHMLDVTVFATSVQVYNRLKPEYQEILKSETLKAADWMTNENMESHEECIKEIEKKELLLFVM
jgi:tripartite ATP-independent transporter DctP family solute receptor